MKAKPILSDADKRFIDDVFYEHICKHMSSDYVTVKEMYSRMQHILDHCGVDTEWINEHLVELRDERSLDSW